MTLSQFGEANVDLLVSLLSEGFVKLFPGRLIFVEVEGRGTDDLTVKTGTGFSLGLTWEERRRISRETVQIPAWELIGYKRIGGGFDTPEEVDEVPLSAHPNNYAAAEALFIAHATSRINDWIAAQGLHDEIEEARAIDPENPMTQSRSYDEQSD